MAYACLYCAAASSIGRPTICRAGCLEGGTARATRLRALVVEGLLINALPKVASGTPTCVAAVHEEIHPAVVSRRRQGVVEMVGFPPSTRPVS